MLQTNLQTWITRMLDGDIEAFEEIYKLTRDHVYRTVSFLAVSQQDVPDIVSEVYIELFKSLSNYNAEHNFQAWLNGLIVRQVNNWKRKMWRALRIFQKNKDLYVEEPHIDIEAATVDQENNQELLLQVQKLSYKHKVVIVLRYYHDYSMDEIAQLLMVPVGTVKSRHHHAILKLRKLTEQSIERKEASAHVH